MKKINTKSALLTLFPAALLAILYNLGAGLLVSSANDWFPALEFGGLYIDILFFYALILCLRLLKNSKPANSFENSPILLVLQRTALLILLVVVFNRWIIQLKVASGAWFTYITHGQIATYNFVAILLLLIYVILDLGYELLDKWRKSEAEKEKFARLHAQAQLENLKAQVNPHFLFNSLNTLSSLITEDQNRAKQFVRQLSIVYRYILEHRESQVVSLDREKALFDSYIYLCKMRFEENFVVEEQWPDAMNEFNIPPMTLQILVENAIKHNVISKQKPLTLSVHTEGNKLIVSNTFQPKKQLEAGTGFGLKNINERYAQLTNRRVNVQQLESTFSVELPLIR